MKSQKGGELWAVWLGELLGDFIELYCLVEASLALWSCSQGSNPTYCGMPLVEKSILVFAIHEKYIFICMMLKKAQHSRNMKSQKGGDLGAVWLGELFGDFIELYILVETLLDLWSCSQGSNPSYCGMPLVGKSILVFVIHDKYINICMVLKKAQHSRNMKSQKGGELGAVWLGELLGDFIELYILVETSLALWSCSQGSNPTYWGMPLVENLSLPI